MQNSQLTYHFYTVNIIVALLKESSLNMVKTIAFALS